MMGNWVVVVFTATPLLIEHLLHEVVEVINDEREYF